MRSIVLSLALLTGCTAVSPTPVTPAVISVEVGAVVENAGRSASLWSLTQVGKLNTTVATECAKTLKTGCDTGQVFLQSNAAQMTAAAVNTYLIQAILKNVNSMVAAGIDTAAGILDDILQVPAGTMLTTAELAVLTAFVRGVGEGCDDFLAAKPAQALKMRLTLKARAWMHAPDAGTILIERTTASEVAGMIPPDEVLGKTCADGDPPGYFGHFGWIPGALSDGR